VDEALVDYETRASVYEALVDYELLKGSLLRN
jgi:hypothetical protein